MSSPNQRPDNQDNPPQPETPGIRILDGDFPTHFQVSGKEKYLSLSSYDVQGKLGEMRDFVEALNRTSSVDARLRDISVRNNSERERLTVLKENIKEFLNKAEGLIHDVELRQRVPQLQYREMLWEFRELDMQLLLLTYPEIWYEVEVKFQAAIRNRDSKAYNKISNSVQVKLQRQLKQEYEELERRRGTISQQPGDEIRRTILELYFSTLKDYEEPGWRSKLGGLLKQAGSLLESLRS
ncbi:hypothetical protein NMY22_g10359 [Coprinellus aureogranulatus]|nr:hypothetical protein NMY22_g10359 [Coprinellus aureogranulatus]